MSLVNEVPLTVYSYFMRAWYVVVVLVVELLSESERSLLTDDSMTVPWVVGQFFLAMASFVIMLSMKRKIITPSAAMNKMPIPIQPMALCVNSSLRFSIVRSWGPANVALGNASWSFSSI